MGWTYDNLCGQPGYDGAGNMVGKYQGAAAIIQQVYPMAHYQLML